MDYITFQTQYAKRYGVNPAIVLHTLTYFVLKNKKAGRNKYEDKYWTFNSYPGWQEAMPFFSKSQIRTAMLVLRKKGAIIVGNFNKKGYDKTFWYKHDMKRYLGWSLNILTANPNTKNANAHAKEVSTSEK